MCVGAEGGLKQLNLVLYFHFLFDEAQIFELGASVEPHRHEGQEDLGHILGDLLERPLKDVQI